MYNIEKLNSTNIVRKHNVISLSHISKPYRKGLEKYKFQIWSLSESVQNSMIAIYESRVARANKRQISMRRPINISYDIGNKVKDKT